MIVELGIGFITIGAVLYALCSVQTRKFKLAVRAGKKAQKTEESNC
jgi:hypothetical protein